MKYTLAQECAVFFGDGNLLLSAAAGSGKTAALTGRISELLVQGRAELSEMLIVTYTRAAAAEMKSRISKRLREMAAEGHRVGRHLAALPAADISTIHSFLYKSLRPYFPSLGLSQDYRITDMQTIRVMKADAMRDVVDDFFSRGSQKPDERTASFVELADVIGQARDTAALDAELLRIADALTRAAADESALDRYADMLDEAADGIMQSKYGNLLRERLTDFTNHYLRVFSECEDDFASYPKVLEKYGPTLAYIIDWLRQASRAAADGAAYGEIRGIFDSFAPPTLGKLSSKDACDASDRFKFYRDSLKGEIERYSSDFFRFTEEEIEVSAKHTAAVLRCARHVVGAYFRELDRRKRAASALEYNDLENLAVKLFISPDGSPTNAAREVGSRYKYIFIDEYQDTNSVQDKIFRAISSGKTVRFMVGDVKQSIYRFRGAEPEVFSEYRRRWQTIKPDGNSIEQYETKNLPEFSPDDGYALFMSENFRCDDAVVRFVNMVSDYTLPHGRIPYSDDDALIHAKLEGGDDPVEVCLIECPRKRASDDETEETANGKRQNPEAKYIARRISEMIGKYSPDGSRLLRASDIAIIMRSPSPRSAISAAADYESALAEYGIPVKMKTARPVTSYPSVMLLLCLLHAVDNPLRDIYTAGAMRSPVFGFTIADIVALRNASALSSDSNMPLYMAAESIAENHEHIMEKENFAGQEVSAEQEPEERPKLSPELREKCASFVAWIARHKIAARGTPADRYLEFLIHDARIFAIDGIRGNPTERDAVNAFCTMARTYEGSGDAGLSHFGGISGFLGYIADAGGEEETTNLSDADAVSLMSIHTSKGLEFPVCFLAECAKRRNTADERGNVLIDRELGLGMYLPDEGGLVRCGNLIRGVIAEKMRGEAVAEEMRMLYVALTRARNRLIVTARVPDVEKLLSDAEMTRDTADGYFVTGQASYIHWIVSAAAKYGDADFYRITSIHESDILGDDAEEEESSGEGAMWEAKTTDEAFDSDTEKRLRERFSFAYPHEYLAAIPSKLSVSGLYPEILDEGRAADALYEITGGGFALARETAFSEEADDRQEKPKSVRPRFMTGESDVKATDRGNATHVFMQFADFDSLAENGVEYELERLVRERYISKKLAELVNLGQLKRFARSELMEKMRRSPMVKREFRFNTLMAAENFTAETALKEQLRGEGVKITVQGVVDCVFRDPDTGRLVLVDYKTDHVTAEEWQNRALAKKKLADRHRSQLMYYKQICEKMFSEEIPETLLYSTVLGECVRIDV